MKKLFVTLILLLSNPLFAQSWTILSPDSKSEISILFDDGQLIYSITADGQTLVADAELDLTVRMEGSNSEFSLNGARINKVSQRQVNEIISPVVRQKSATIANNFNSKHIHFDNGLSVEFRAFNNGVAYRFASEINTPYYVLSEKVELNFTANYTTEYPLEKSFYSHNERTYQHTPLSLLTSEHLASLPLLIETPQHKVVFTETDLNNYPGLWVTGGKGYQLNGIQPKRVLNAELKPGSDRNQNILTRAKDIAFIKQNTKRAFPWRIFAISREDGELLTNQLSFLLAEENQIANSSWIKPGKVAWDWWNANNLFDVDFKAGINTQTYKYYIDFAAKYGLEYIILDEGWYPLGNALDIVPEIDLHEIIRYGKEKGVGVILWVIWETIEQDLDRILAQYHKWGAQGIKVDFMQRDDQAMVDYYWRVAKVAAKYQLLVNFHGSYKPAGLRRTYPNVITREGVRGLEHNKWGDYITSEHNLTLPFIRMLAGPMDYTPGAMVNAQPENFHISFNRPMSKTTRAHQVALYVVFESPLQMLADSPSQYLKEHHSTRFISNIPTVWDETKVLSAKLKDHIVIARRSGKDWFVAALGNDKPRIFDLNLSFLKKGQYQLNYFEDGPNAHAFASDHKIGHIPVRAEDNLSINLAPNGGWAAKITPLD